MWWIDIVVPVLMLCGIYGFLELVGFRTRFLNHKTDRTAESMYANYADSPGKQRKYAREHGGQWQEDEAMPPADPRTRSRPRR